MSMTVNMVSGRWCVVEDGIVLDWFGSNAAAWRWIDDFEQSRGDRDRRIRLLMKTLRHRQQHLFPNRESRRDRSAFTQLNKDTCIMSDTMTKLPATEDAFGFHGGDDDDYSARLVKGAILRCVDGSWKARDGTVLAPDQMFACLGTQTALQLWQDGLPADSIVKTPGKALPAVAELNSAIPEANWAIGKFTNEPTPPWKKVWIAYLLDPVTARMFTFINDTNGARRAVTDLSDQVMVMRHLRGTMVLPIVQLSSAPMPTQWGQKIRPAFKVITWRQTGLKVDGPKIEHKPDAPVAPDLIGEEVEPVTVGEEMDDEIGF
jgi:hypothetical protein